MRVVLHVPEVFLVDQKIKLTLLNIEASDLDFPVFPWEDTLDWPLNLVKLKLLNSCNLLHLFVLLANIQDCVSSFHIVLHLDIVVVISFLYHKGGLATLILIKIITKFSQIEMQDP